MASRRIPHGRLNRVQIPRLRSSVLLAIAMVLLATNLRPAAAAVGPLIDRIKADTGLSAAGAGALTTLPVLCFGALAPLTPVLAKRLGERTTAALALVVLLIGTLVRLVPGLGFLFFGTALAGAAIAVGNVLLPILVRGNFPERVGLLTGMYTTALVGFASLAAGVTVPVADAFGGGWRPGLAIWAVPTVVALVVWAPQMGRGRPTRADPGAAVIGARSLLRDPVAWSVTLFFAFQSAGFYATLAWLPSVFHSHGFSTPYSGFLLSLSLLVGLIPALTVPSLAARAGHQRAFVVVFASLVATGWLGIILAPTTAPYVWVVILGLGQNAFFPLALTLIVLRGGSVPNTAALSTMVQTVGYLMAALAPLAIGAVHDISGSWTPALIVLLALLLPQTVMGLEAARNRTVTPARTPAGTPT
jgi:CP family cyanate transporter-like MFS transporter